jgi:ribosomal protein S18 acetylase RimI-like enzyme
MGLFDELMWPGDIFAAHMDCKKIYDMYALGTHPDYRGRGLATKLVLESFKVAKKSDCDCVTVLATNDFSRKIFNNVGMSILKTKPWNECYYDDTKVFGDVKSKHLSSHFMIL